jgi:hypothetical protein
MRTTNWLFGRGLSISCNLTWNVPGHFKQFTREQKIKHIKVKLRSEMSRQSVDCLVIQNLLTMLATRTAPDWRHRLLTTNWDYLLQREIQALKLKALPTWLVNSHVFHLNGTVENLSDNTNRSALVLEDDTSEERRYSAESNVAFNDMCWDEDFVVIGMSFECEVDKFLLTALKKVQDNLPIGQSRWLLVNPDINALDASCDRIRSALPKASVQSVKLRLDEWINAELPEMQSWG